MTIGQLSNATNLPPRPVNLATTSTTTPDSPLFEPLVHLIVRGRLVARPLLTPVDRGQPLYLPFGIFQRLGVGLYRMMRSIDCTRHRDHSAVSRLDVGSATSEQNPPRGTGLTPRRSERFVGFVTLRTPAMSPGLHHRSFRTFSLFDVFQTNTVSECVRGQRVRPARP